MGSVTDGPPSGGGVSANRRADWIKRIHYWTRTSGEIKPPVFFPVPPWEVESAPRVSRVNQSGRHVGGERWEVGGGVVVVGGGGSS